VFAICGLVGLALLVGLAFLATRQARRKRRLEKEVISWDPNDVQAFSAQASITGQKADDGRSLAGSEKSFTPRPSDAAHYGYTLPSINTGGAFKPSYGYGGHQPVQVALPSTTYQLPYQRGW